MNIVDTSVRNCMDSVIGLNGVSIPAKQSRMVRGLDLDDERVRARVEAGDIEIAGYSILDEDNDYVKAVADTEEELAGEDSAEESVPDTVRHRLFGG